MARTSFIGRLPLWATLVPLAAGILVWALLWRGYAAAFEADLARLLPGEAIETGGFPYRLEARLESVAVEHADVALEVGLRAREVSVNRVPWAADRQVINLVDSVATLGLSPLAGATVRVEAAEAQASLRLAGARIARASAVWQDPRLTTGLLPLPIAAQTFEAHLRETPSAGETTPASPRLPTQVQLVLAGEGVRLGDGAPLALRLDSELTAGAAIDSLAAWAAGGTAEIRTLTLADATGEVLRLSATVVPDGRGGLRAAGVLETVCPANVRAAFAGTAPVSERRARRPERIAFAGALPGGVVAVPRDPARPAPPVRGQQPPCPRLR